MTVRKGRLYPLRAFTKDEAYTVIAFGMHKPPALNEDIRGGFAVLAGVALVVVGIAAAVVGLVWYGVTHP